MGRAPCCDKSKVKRGPWSPEEDATLKNFIQQNGTGGNWIALPTKAGLKRCGKSCRLRWLNYLRPDIKHGGFTEEEDNTICRLFTSIGSRWSLIASQLPGRTDNDVKNYWNTKLKKKFLAGKIENSASNEKLPQIWANSVNAREFETFNDYPGFKSESANSDFMPPPPVEMGNYFCNCSQRDFIFDQNQFRWPMDVSNFSYGYSDGTISSSSSSSVTTVALEDNCAAPLCAAGNGSSEDGIPPNYFGLESLNCDLLLNDFGFDQEIKMSNYYLEYSNF